MRDQSLRFVIRPSGMSIIKEDSMPKGVANLVNKTCLDIDKIIKGEGSVRNIRHIFPMSSEEA